METMDDEKTVRTASLYRMMLPGHVCPWGLKVKHLLERSGYRIDDHPLTSREAIDAFKAEHGVATTPQVFVGGQRIGGYDDTRRYLGKRVRDPGAPTYRPVIALFAIAAAMAMAASTAVHATPFTLQALVWFGGFAMTLLAMLKLQDIESFSAMFLNYDLLARRWVPYSYLYPFAEATAGVLMIAGVARWLSVPLALVIGTIGAVSVFKAVYVEKRELKCACVGGSSNVPLGFVSLTENLMMVGMAIWMLVAPLGGHA